MTFTDQWANRHDGECENEEIRGINFMIIGYRCHCYRRWLEARLGEIYKIIHPVLDTHDALRAVDRIRSLLPPKGAE